jgi:hypothetical protein
VKENPKKNKRQQPSSPASAVSDPATSSSPSALRQRLKVGFYFGLWYALNVYYNSKFAMVDGPELKVLALLMVKLSPVFLRDSRCHLRRLRSHQQEAPERAATAVGGRIGPARDRDAVRVSFVASEAP